MKIMSVDRHDKARDYTHDITPSVMRVIDGDNLRIAVAPAMASRAFAEMLGHCSPTAEVNVRFEWVSQSLRRGEKHDTIVWGDTTIELWDYWYETYRMKAPTSFTVKQ